MFRCQLGNDRLQSLREQPIIGPAFDKWQMQNGQTPNIGLSVTRL
jgi:hypothetical protein